MFSIRSHRRFAVPIRKRKLTTEQVLEARLRFASGEKDWSHLGRAYGVSRETIKNAVLGYTFKELPMPPKRSWADRPFPYG
jgi:hypothetical protein